MDLKKNRLYSKFNYTPRYYDEKAEEWLVRRKEIGFKIHKQGHDIHDFITLQNRKSDIKKIFLLIVFLFFIISIPLFYGWGIVPLSMMALLSFVFLKINKHII